MASPYWDIATLCNAGNFSVEKALSLITLYDCDGPTLDIEILQSYRIALMLLSILWMSRFTTENLDAEITRVTELAC